MGSQQPANINTNPFGITPPTISCPCLFGRHANSQSYPANPHITITTTIHPSIALQINLNAADYFLSVSVTHSRRSRLSTPSSIHPQCVYLIRMSFRLRVFTCSFVFFVSCALEKRWGVRIELQIYIEWEWQTP